MLIDALACCTSWFANRPLLFRSAVSLVPPTQRGVGRSRGRSGAPSDGAHGYSESEVHSKGVPAAFIREVTAAAHASGLHTQVVIVRDANDFERAFSTIRHQHLQAVIVFGTAFAWSFRKTIAALALKYRVPTICGIADYMSADFLTSY